MESHKLHVPNHQPVVDNGKSPFLMDKSTINDDFFPLKKANPVDSGGPKPLVGTSRHQALGLLAEEIPQRRAEGLPWFHGGGCWEI